MLYNTISLNALICIIQFCIYYCYIYVIIRLNIHYVPNSFWLLFLPPSFLQLHSFTSLSLPPSLRAGSQVISPSWILSHRLFGSSCCWPTLLSAVCFFFLLGTHKHTHILKHHCLNQCVWLFCEIIMIYLSVKTVKDINTLFQRCKLNLQLGLVFLPYWQIAFFKH